MSYASTYPETVSALILMNSAPANYQGWKSFLDSFAQHTSHIKEEVAPLFNHEKLKNLDKYQIDYLFRELFSVYFYDPKNVDKLTIKNTQESAEFGSKTSHAMGGTVWENKNFNIFSELQKLNIPTLVISCRQDIMPEEIKDAIPGAKALFLDQCNHFPYIEQPQETFNSIESFLKTNNDQSK